jgi:hypothetical protein
MTYAIRPYQRNKRVCPKAAWPIRDAAAVVAAVEVPRLQVPSEHSFPRRVVAARFQQMEKLK